MQLQLKELLIKFEQLQQDLLRFASYPDSTSPQHERTPTPKSSKCSPTRSSSKRSHLGDDDGLVAPGTALADAAISETAHARFLR